MPMKTTKRWLSLQDLADELDISYQTIRRWHSQGRLPRSHRFGAVIRFKREDVDAWIEQHAEDRNHAAA